MIHPLTHWPTETLTEDHIVGRCPECGNEQSAPRDLIAAQGPIFSGICSDCGAILVLDLENTHYRGYENDRMLLVLPTEAEIELLGLPEGIPTRQDAINVRYPQ